MAASDFPRNRAGNRPRILFLSCHLPWPAISGGRRRELELIRRLSDQFDIHLVVISKTVEEDLGNMDALRGVCRQVEVFPAAARPELPIGPRRKRSRQSTRHRCPPATRRVVEIIARGQLDLVHVEGYYLMQHLPDEMPLPVLLAEQNVEYELERQRIAAARSASAGTVASRPRRARRDCLRTRSEELSCWSRASALATVTLEDREMIQASLPAADVRVVPDGADHLPSLEAMARRQPLQRPRAPLVTLVANFAYSPNVDAAIHLCHEILPLVRASVPDLELWLVGNEPPRRVRTLAHERVRVAGRVDDVVAHLDAADVIVCPLRIGGGIKVKTIEALRRGKAIVSTSIGAQGLPEEAREAVAIADDPPAFADALTRLLIDPRQRAELERRAARAATLLPSWDDATRALASIYTDLLERPAPANPETRAAMAKVPA